MDVHVVLYHWCTDEEEGTDIVGAYTNYNRACDEMRAHMAEVRRRVVENYGEKFHEDFEMDAENYFAFGRYGNGCLTDNTWSGCVETVTVEE